MNRLAYASRMKRVDFYFHDGCLSEPSILQLAKDVEAAYPRWTVAVHPHLDDDGKAMGFKTLPAIAINGVSTVFERIRHWVKRWCLLQPG